MFYRSSSRGGVSIGADCKSLVGPASGADGSKSTSLQRGVSCERASCTAPMVDDRVRSVTEFLDYLAQAEAEQRPAEPVVQTADPSTAGAGDSLDGGLVCGFRRKSPANPG